MTCDICKDKGYYYVDDYNPEGWFKLFFACPYCEKGEQFKGKGDDIQMTSNYHVEFEEREIAGMKRDDI